MEDDTDTFGMKPLKRELRPRKIPVQNIVVRLIRRETMGTNRKTDIMRTRHLYQNIFPNFTVVNVEKPPCFLRKFSPDGRYMLAFSSDQTSLEIYKFKGSAGAGDLLKDVDSDYVTDFEKWIKDYDTVRKSIFSKFFSLTNVVNLSQNSQRLNRECSLFTSCGRYVIVASACTIAEDRPCFYEIYTNNEAVTPHSGFLLEDYTIYLVDIEQGVLCDKRQFRVDKILLSHNQGMYLYQNTLAVLSVQHQTIHIFYVENGKFTNVRQIGRNCFEDDDLIMAGWALKVPGSNVNMSYRETTINALKHKLLIFLYKRAKHMSEVQNNTFELRKFYQHFDQLNALRMWKMQLLDGDHLLIKYASEEIVTFKARDQMYTQPSFFVIYNMRDAQVLAVFENTSDELLWIFENYCDYFCNHWGPFFPPCTPGNNIHARLHHQRAKQLMESARNGGATEAVKRLLVPLPISAQSYSSSPYLDLSLFSYNEKWVNVMERPKCCCDYPIRFYGRDSGLLKFYIHTGLLLRPPSVHSVRKLAAFSFHPVEPFAISVQRTNSEYIVNFHVPHTPAI